MGSNRRFKPKIRIYDPDRPAKILDIGIGINAAFAGPIRPCDDPEFRLVKPCARHDPASRISFCFHAGLSRHCAQRSRSNPFRTSGCSHRGTISEHAVRRAYGRAWSSRTPPRFRAFPLCKFFDDNPRHGNLLGLQSAIGYFLYINLVPPLPQNRSL